MVMERTPSLTSTGIFISISVSEEIQLSGLADYNHLVIYDIQGKVVLNQSTSGDTEKLKIESFCPSKN